LKNSTKDNKQKLKNKLANNKTLRQDVGMQQLLTTSNPKILKGTKLGYLSSGIHLAPYTLSGKNTCPKASPGCGLGCLNTAGMGVYNITQQSRITKTNEFWHNRQEFLANLYREVTNTIKLAKKKGLIPCFRFNLTSDIAWESIKFKGKNFMDHFPNVQFYDYTKDDKRMLRFLSGDFPKNYHLTFSRSETNDKACNIVLACGGNIAVVFSGSLPETYKGKKVINAVENDLRFLDPKGVVCGLVALGKAKKDTSGFVVTNF